MSLEILNSDERAFERGKEYAMVDTHSAKLLYKVAVELLRDDEPLRTKTCTMILDHLMTYGDVASVGDLMSETPDDLKKMIMLNRRGNFHC